MPKKVPDDKDSEDQPKIVIDDAGEPSAKPSGVSFLSGLLLIVLVVAAIGSFSIIGLLYLVTEGPNVRKSVLSFAVFGVIFLQVVSGILNIALLTPVETQIIHLGLADALWILLVFFSLYNWKIFVPSYS